MSKACPNMEVELSAYFDDELEPHEIDAVDEHLVDCENCRLALQEMAKIREAFSSLSPPGKQKPIFQDLMAKLQKS